MQLARLETHLYVYTTRFISTGPRVMLMPSCVRGARKFDKFATDNTPVFLGGAPELRPVVELLQSMKEAINNNHNQLTTHVRLLDGKIGRLEAEVKGLQVRHLCFWFLS